MSMRIKLTERYYIMTSCGLIECDGKKIDDDFAITKNWKDNTYNITHIPSGLGLASKSYRKLKECMEDSEKLINNGRIYIENNMRKIQGCIETFNNLLERKVFND